MNQCVFMGRIVRPLELRYTVNNKAVLSFSIAVDRGGKETDFVPCVAWERQAEFIARFFDKGAMICVAGEMRSRSYEDKAKVKRTVLECAVSRVSFTGEKRAEATGVAFAAMEAERGGALDGFVEMEDDGDVPF